MAHTPTLSSAVPVIAVILMSLSLNGDGLPGAFE